MIEKRKSHLKRLTQKRFLSLSPIFHREERKRFIFFCLPVSIRPCFPTVGLRILRSGDFHNTLRRLCLWEAVAPTAPSSPAFLRDVPVLLPIYAFSLHLLNQLLIWVFMFYFFPLVRVDASSSLFGSIKMGVLLSRKKVGDLDRL